MCDGSARGRGLLHTAPVTACRPIPPLPSPVAGHAARCLALPAARSDLYCLVEHAGARKEHAPCVVRALCAAGASIDAADEMGQTPLSYANHAGHFEVIEALVLAGAEESSVVALPSSSPAPKSAAKKKKKKGAKAKKSARKSSTSPEQEGCSSGGRAHKEAAAKAGTAILMEIS